MRAREDSGLRVCERVVAGMGGHQPQGPSEAMRRPARVEKLGTGVLGISRRKGR